MRHHSPALFQLIQRLNQAEARHFHRLAHLHRRESPHYYQYFLVLRNMESFSPETERELLQNAPYFNRLPVLKRQLFEKLLEALDDLHRRADPEEQVKALLHECYLLIKKQLSFAASERLGKARRIIERDAHFHLWPAWHQMDLRLAEQQIRSGSLNTDGIRHERQWPDHLAQTEQLHQVQLQKVKLYFNHFRNLSQKMEVGKISIDDQGHPRLVADQLQAAALDAFSRGDPNQARLFNSQQLNHLKVLDSNIKSIPERLLTTTYNLLLDHLHLGHYEELAEGLEQLRALPKLPAFRRTPRIKSRIFEWGFQLELNAYLRRGEWRTGYHRLQELNKGFHVHQGQLSAPGFAALHFMAALFCFHLRDLNRCLDFLHPLYQQTAPPAARDIYHYAHFLHLLCHVELDNHETAQSLLQALSRKSAQFKEPVEKDLLTFVRQLLRKPHQRKHLMDQWLPQYDTTSKLEQHLHLSQWLGLS